MRRCVFSQRSDLDPRWVVKLIRQGRMSELEMYKTHVIEQAVTLS